MHTFRRWPSSSDLATAKSCDRLELYISVPARRDPRSTEPPLQPRPTNRSATHERLRDGHGLTVPAVAEVAMSQPMGADSPLRALRGNSRRGVGCTSALDGSLATSASRRTGRPSRRARRRVINWQVVTERGSQSAPASARGAAAAGGATTRSSARE